MVDLSEQAQRRREHFRSLKAQADEARTVTERFADDLVQSIGSFSFLIFHVVWFTVWIFLNIGIIPGIEAFDPFPFGLLTMVVSLEAIFLSVFVLISQNRAQKIADIREEVSLHVTTQSEKEVTETLRIVDAIAQNLKIKLKDEKQIHRMEKGLNRSLVEKEIEKEF